MKKPLVSVLIPCYNAERWVSDTLDSVYSQTWTNIEVIVVNDGSTDGTASILEKYRSKGVVLVDQPNGGQTTALNRCLAEAKGDFVQYLDADDLLSHDKIERQMQLLMERPNCISTAEWARFRTDPSLAQFDPNTIIRQTDPVDWLVHNWKDGGGMMYPAMWLLPMALVRSIGPWRNDLSLTNDNEYFTRAVLASRQVLFAAGARTYYRSGISGSLSGLKSKSGWESQFNVLSACEGYLLTRESTERTRYVCSMLWQRFAHAAYPYQRLLANHALTRATLLHSKLLTPDGGKRFRFLAAAMGWKAARLLQRLSGRP